MSVPVSKADRVYDDKGREWTKVDSFECDNGEMATVVQSHDGVLRSCMSDKSFESKGWRGSK
jgi:hypothetical protein